MRLHRSYFKLSPRGYAWGLRYETPRRGDYWIVQTYDLETIDEYRKYNDPDMGPTPQGLLRRLRSTAKDGRHYRRNGELIK